MVKLLHLYIYNFTLLHLFIYIIIFIILFVTWIVNVVNVKVHGCLVSLRETGSLPVYHQLKFCAFFFAQELKFKNMKTSPNPGNPSRTKPNPIKPNNTNPNRTNHNLNKVYIYNLTTYLLKENMNLSFLISFGLSLFRVDPCSNRCKLD